MPDESAGFKREIGLRDLILFNVSSVVGIRWLAAAAHTGPGSITLWVLSALLFFVPCAYAVAALAKRFPVFLAVPTSDDRGLSALHP